MQMKINYADRRNDKNILDKSFSITDSPNLKFAGKIGLIKLNQVADKFIAKRPDGKADTVIDSGYKILTYFPEKDLFCCSVSFDKENNIVQWYFDILKTNTMCDDGIPCGEDMFLDVVMLPNGEFYTLDEDELGEALNNKLITEKEFHEAYANKNKVENFIKTNYAEFYKFTNDSFNLLK